MSTKRVRRKVKEATFEERCEVYCDRCGAMVSNGGADFEGWPNFYGVWMKLRKMQEFTHDRPKIEFELPRFNYADQAVQATLTWPRGSGREEGFALCRDCADAVRGFIQQGRGGAA